MARSAAFLSALLLAAAAAAAEPPQILPVSEIKRGMKGHGLSVFEGTRIEKFDVEVIDILRRALPQIDLILIRVNHPVINHANVIGGMSGSPIFIDGKLIGALAYGWSFSKDPIAGVTPIEAMLAETRRPAIRTGSLERRDGPAGIEPCVTPLSLAGFSAGGARWLGGILRQHGIEPLEGGGGGEAPAQEIVLEPGSAVGVSFIRGDLNATATGTVTWVDGDTVLAFGHPFLGGGESALPMTTAVIHMVLPSVARSFKLSSPVRQVGAMVQDRTPCIVGKLGAAAPMVAVHVKLEHAGTGHESAYNYEVIQHPLFTPFLVFSVLGESVDTGEGQTGETTLTADLTIKLAGLDAFTYREVLANPANVFNPNIATELLRLHQNPFERAKLEQVDAVLTVEEGHRGATLERAWFDRERVRPGEKATLTVQLRRFRGEVELRSAEVEIPVGEPEGTMEVLVTGRGETPSGLPPPTNLREMVAEILERPSATAFVINTPSKALNLRFQGRSIPSLPNSALASWVPAIQVPADLAQGMRRQVVETPYVVNGSVRTSIVIRK